VLSTGALPVAYERRGLDNGLRIVACELRETRAASVRVYLTGGSRAEPDDLAGVAHFLEHAVF
jgi:predicted Zn-dependent peptidase